MFERPFWINRIEEAWQQVPIAWLCGVRRCGKTTLAESLHTVRIAPATMPLNPQIALVGVT
jgi:predicted AAA+ superfamily ATPase